MFYGANGHYDYNQSIEEQIRRLQLVNMDPGYYRIAWEGDHTMDYCINLAKALEPTGIEMVCCINIKIDDPGSSTGFYTSEKKAYDYALRTGRKVVEQLAPLGVTLFETGNELDAMNGHGIRTPVPDVQGGVPEDFLLPQFTALRGVMNGCTEAIRRHAPKSRVLSNAFTACSFACSDMLYDGTAPDGSAGHDQVDWDITNWHNYRCYGSMLWMSMDYQKPDTNLLDHLKAAYKKPIFVTEWNANEGDDDATRAAWANQFLGELYGAGKDIFGVEAAIVYQLICGDPWGVVNYDGTIQSTFGETVRDFIAAHPA